MSTEVQSTEPKAPNTAAPEQTQDAENLEASEASNATEGNSSLDGPEQDQTEEQKDKPKLGNASKKIGKLTRQKTQLAEEVQYLREQLAKAIAPKQAEPLERSEPQKQDAEPDPNDFETQKDYLRAVAKYEITQELKAEKQKTRESEAKSEYEKTVMTFKEKAQAFAKEHPDYQDALDSVDGIRLSLTVQNAILKHGPELAYTLAQDAENLEQICSMSALDAAEAIGEIRARMKSANVNQKPELKTTNAPKPPSPIASKSAPMRKSLSDEDLSFADYVRMRRDAGRKR